MRVLLQARDFVSHVTVHKSVQVNEAVLEANVFSLASHIWWGVWAILQV